MTLPEELLLIDKPIGMTSHDVVDEVRRIYRTRRVGHAGTLDPFATGLLIIGVDRGTKKLTGLVGLDKTYVATARLGATSTTDDPEGVVTVTPETKHPTTEEIEAALNIFRGSYIQTAPIYSAKKVNGKKLYELARKGLGDTVELPKKLVSIHDLRITNYAWPELTFEVSCSSGTYIRALARDIGKELGCGAYLVALHRTRIGDFRVEDAKPIDGLEQK